MLVCNYKLIKCILLGVYVHFPGLHLPFLTLASCVAAMVVLPVFILLRNILIQEHTRSDDVYILVSDSLAEFISTGMRDDGEGTVV